MWLMQSISQQCQKVTELRLSDEVHCIVRVGCFLFNGVLKLTGPCMLTLKVHGMLTFNQVANQRKGVLRGRRAGWRALISQRGL